MTQSLLKRWPRIVWIVFVLALPAAIIHAYFTKIVECPSCYLFEDSADGLKNYYTLVYYVQHDKGWHFSGMNYPYGEHIIYTDNQPVLALTLNWIDKHIMDMDRHVVGTMNMLMLLSIFFAVIVSYLLLRRWGVGRWWSLGSAICIIFLSPQLLRMHGHYGLSYVVFLPLLFLLMDLTVRDQRKRWLWAMLMTLWVILISLIHLYFFLMSTLFLASFLLFWWWYHRKEKQFIRSVLPCLAGAIVIPAVVLIGVKSGTDTITDRPTEPWGLESFLATFETTFISSVPPFDKAWSDILKKDKPDIEKNAYTGFIGLLMLPALLFFLLKKEPNDFMNRHVKTFLAVAVLIWCMAAGAIYQLGFKFLWDIIPMIKQFRSLGRFGIAFYYLYMLACSYVLWRMYVLLMQKDLARVGKYVLTTVFIVWAFEGWLHMKAISAPVFRLNNSLSSDKNDYIPILEAAGKKPADYQAILLLPLVAIGNETMGISRGFWALNEGVHASNETGLPLINYAMSRTSISHGLDILELISSPYIEKKRASQFDERPLLLLCDEPVMIPEERKWIDKAEKMGTYKSISVYTLPVSVFKNKEPNFLPADQSNNCNAVYNGFDDPPTDIKMSGNGALYIDQEPVSVWKYVDTSAVAQNWQVTFWSHIDNSKGAMPYGNLIEYDANGNVIKEEGWHRDEILWSEAYGEWVQVTFPIATQGKGFVYELTVGNSRTWIDNLMIIPPGGSCIMNTPEMILYNNIPIPR